jgi:hypothetical protein
MVFGAAGCHVAACRNDEGKAPAITPSRALAAFQRWLSELSEPSGC